MDRHNLHEEVEMDGAPVEVHANNFRRDVFSKLRSEDIRTQCDSGFESGLCSSNIDPETESLRGTKSKNENCSSMSHEFEKLKLGVAHNTQQNTLPSIDEGFHNHSIHSFNEGQTTAFAEPDIDDSCVRAVGVAVDINIDRAIAEAFSFDDDYDTQLNIALIQLLPDIAEKIINLAPSSDYLNLQNNLMQTPLHLAVITKQHLLVRRLLVGGASVTCRDRIGCTPLHVACRNGHIECVAALLEPVNHAELKQLQYNIPYQAIPQDLNDRNYEGQTVTHIVAERGHLDILSVLLEKGADINVTDGKSGRTVLHYAAESGNMELLNFLLHCKFLNLNALTYGGVTAVKLAAGRGHNGVIELLRGCGADMSQTQQEDFDSEDSDDDVYDDFCINGEPVIMTT